MADRVESKSGVRTTEFWLSVAVIVGGAILAWRGRELIGAGVATASGIGYALARSFEKRAAHRANGEVSAAVASARSRIV